MTTSDIIALSSVVIAVCALVATAWQAWLAHRHNRLSVRPLLVWHVARRNSPSSAGITYSLKNLGLGPAIIRDRYFTKDSMRFSPPDLQTDEVPAFANHVFGTRINYHLRQSGLPGKDAAIPSEGEVVIADIEFPDLPASQLQAVVDIAGNIAFYVEYESLYREKYQLVGGQEES